MQAPSPVRFLRAVFLGIPASKRISSLGILKQASCFFYQAGEKRICNNIDI